jgi:hypothetical protein
MPSSLLGGATGYARSRQPSGKPRGKTRLGMQDQLRWEPGVQQLGSDLGAQAVRARQAGQDGVALDQRVGRHRSSGCGEPGRVMGLMPLGERWDHDTRIERRHRRVRSTVSRATTPTASPATGRRGQPSPSSSATTPTSTCPFCRRASPDNVAPEGSSYAGRWTSTTLRPPPSHRPAPGKRPHRVQDGARSSGGSPPSVLTRVSQLGASWVRPPPGAPSPHHDLHAPGSGWTARHSVELRKPDHSLDRQVVTCGERPVDLPLAGSHEERAIWPSCRAIPASESQLLPRSVQW